MKLTLCVSMPSAIQATLTPAPVMPRLCAVGWRGLSDAVPVSESPSGASCTWPLRPQAPGITLGVSDDPESELDVAGAVGMSLPPWMVTSGMTSATEEFAASRSSSPADTVAASESTSE